MTTSRRNFIKIAGLFVSAPILTKAEIISELTPNIKQVKPDLDLFPGIAIRYLGRKKVKQPVPPDKINGLALFDSYTADIYHLSRDINGEVFERYCWIDVKLLSVSFDKNRFVHYELKPVVEELLNLKR